MKYLIVWSLICATSSFVSAIAKSLMLKRIMYKYFFICLWRLFLMPFYIAAFLSVCFILSFTDISSEDMFKAVRTSLGYYIKKNFTNIR